MRFKCIHIFSIVSFLTFLLACGPIPTQEKEGLRYRGAVLAHVHRSNLGYGSDAPAQIYTRLKQTGYNSVQLNTFAYQKSIEGTKLFSDDPTLTKKRVIAEVKRAHRRGFKVMLKPHIWIAGASNGSGGKRVWRNQIAFQSEKNLDKWFSAYRDFIVEQAKWAEEANAELFVVGTELAKLTEHSERWRKLITEVRNVYAGKITYAAEAWNAFNIAFWPQLDAIGLDFYYSYERKQNPPRSELARFYADKLQKHYRHAGKLRKPVWLTEVGFPAHSNAIMRPYGWPENQRKSGKKSNINGETLQKKAYQALKAAFNQAGHPQGIWFWKYVTSLDSYERNNYDKGFILQRKPSEKIIEEIFKESSSP